MAFGYVPQTCALSCQLLQLETLGNPNLGGAVLHEVREPESSLARGLPYQEPMPPRPMLLHPATRDGRWE